MIKKRIITFIVILALISPLLAKAQVETKNVPQNNPNQGQNSKSVNDKTNSSTDPKLEEKNRENEAKSRTIQSATNILQKTSREINKLKNIIDRLTNKDSIIAKLNANGINTSAITSKLDSATTLIRQAEENLLGAKETISSTATSTDTNIKTKVIGVRKLFEQAISNSKSALTKIKEANKLIREIPGIRDIEKTGTTTEANIATSSQSI